MPEQIEALIQRLDDFATRHRMMFGMHPDNELIREAIKALQAQSQERPAPAPTPATTPAPTTRRNRRSNTEGEK